VAYSLVFARAVEAALECHPPPRALWLRAVMAELERIANHLGDVGAICNDAAFSMMHAECGILREETLRACAAAFGHRLMMDCVVPGGVAADLEPAGVAAILALTQSLRGQFPALVELYENTASLQDRTVGTGIVSGALAAQFAAPGYVRPGLGARIRCTQSACPTRRTIRRRFRSRPARKGMSMRACGCGSRRSSTASAGSSARSPRSPAARRARSSGRARDERRRRGARRRLSGRCAQLRAHRCRTAHRALPPARSVVVAVPLLEAAIEGNIVADFPLCNKSFNLLLLRT